MFKYLLDTMCTQSTANMRWTEGSIDCNSRPLGQRNTSNSTIAERLRCRVGLRGKVYIRLIRKPVVDFLLVITEHFSLRVKSPRF